MKKVAIVGLSLLLVTVISSCTLVPTVPSEPPVAYIDSVAPELVLVGNEASFAGHGTDKTGTVVAYNWRSSIDGPLGTMASFKTSALSVGKHTVYFSVQNNRGDWSKEVFAFVNVVPRIDMPTINIFTIKPDSISPGSSTTLSWDVSNAAKVTIAPDIGDVSAVGTRVIYPKLETIYTLTAINDAGQVTAQTKVVITAQQTKTVEVYSISNEDGTVRRDTIIEFDPKVGENISSVPMQAFLSFDISMIPQGSQITSATLDITNHNIFGYPFSFLGGMGVFAYQYGTLESKDYVVGYPRGALYTSYLEPTQPYTANMIATAIQEQVNKGNSRFQVRLQFEKYWYGGGQANYMGLNSDLIKLTINYQ